VENYVADSSHSDISLNFTNISDGTIRAFINEDYIYTNNHVIPEIIFTSENDMGTTSYEINFSITKIRTNMTHFVSDPGGDIEVVIYYTDLNSSEVETATLNSDEDNVLTINYQDESTIEIAIGEHDGSDGSLRISSSTYNTVAIVQFAAVLPPINESKKLGYAYDGTIEYVQGDIMKVGRVGK
jgi:hypothetical protein